MSPVTVPTVCIDNVKKTITIINNEIEDTKDKWIGDNDTDDEKISLRYIKRELRLEE